MTARRFPPPWSVEELEACVVAERCLYASQTNRGWHPKTLPSYACARLTGLPGSPVKVPKEIRMRRGIYLAVIGLVVPTIVSAQQFHPTMVEVGTVSPQQPHVIFDPQFPSAPKVVLSIRDQVVGGQYRGCGVEAKNITATGFAYFPACSARRPGGPLPVPLNLEATWIATLQQ